MPTQQPFLYKNDVSKLYKNYVSDGVIAVIRVIDFITFIMMLADLVQTVSTEFV